MAKKEKTGPVYQLKIALADIRPPIWRHFLIAINDPEHEEHEDLLEWVGGEFDSEEFDLDEVNKRLAEIR